MDYTAAFKAARRLLEKATDSLKDGTAISHHAPVSRLSMKSCLGLMTAEDIKGEFSGRVGALINKMANAVKTESERLGASVGNNKASGGKLVYSGISLWFTSRTTNMRFHVFLFFTFRFHLFMFYTFINRNFECVLTSSVQSGHASHAMHDQRTFLNTKK